DGEDTWLEWTDWVDTGDDGVYTVGIEPGETYTVSTHMPGLGERFLGDVASGYSSDVVTFTSATTSPLPPLRHRHTTTIAGLLQDSDGQPAADTGVELLLLDTESRYATSAGYMSTTEDGEYGFAIVEGFTYTVAAYHPEYG